MLDELNDLPPSSVNNSREIVIRKIKNFKERPSEYKLLEINDMSGIDADWNNYDNGN